MVPTSFCSECLCWLKPFYSHYVHDFMLLWTLFFFNCSMERISCIIVFVSLNLLENQGVQCPSTFLILKHWAESVWQSERKSNCSAGNYYIYPSKHFTTGVEKSRCQNYKHGTARWLLPNLSNLFSLPTSGSTLTLSFVSSSFSSAFISLSFCLLPYFLSASPQRS